MPCDNGDAITLTLCEPDYRLRIVADTVSVVFSRQADDPGHRIRATVAVLLSREEVAQLQARIREVLEEEPC